MNEAIPKASHLIEAQAWLLRSQKLRRAFRTNPIRLADELGLKRADRASFARLDPDGIERQAAALIWKRLHAVQRFMPRTLARLGSWSRPVFQLYAESNWPEGHRRHWLDGAGFAEFLRRRRAPELDPDEARQFDSTASRRRIEFVVRDPSNRSGIGIQWLAFRARFFNRSWEFRAPAPRFARKQQPPFARRID